ncbi:MAG: tetratricopeptide repeat protein [Betaproteobacteria bacterium]|nr:tetratricopeptide repeat protein [Betaproteobacteria bacterium]
MLARLFRQLLSRAKQPVPQALAGVDDALGRIKAGQEAEKAGRPEDAMECYESALREFPDSAELHAMLGNALRALGRHDEAVAAYRQSTQLKPALAAAWYNLALTEHELGDVEGAERDYRAALAADPGLVTGHDSLLCLVGMGGAGRTPADVLAEHQRWAARHAEPFRARWQPFANVADPERRLRIGYVSADLRYHAIACFVEPVLAHRDRAAFEIFCYDNSAGTDAVKERLKSLADHWRAINAMGDAEVAAMVVADGIDILVDLSGHTKGNRLLAFARKPAPVQATWLGYPNTTGLGAIDWRITDAIADPPAMTDASYSERLLRLPGSMWCYQPFDAMLEPGAGPEPGNAPTFGSMNSFPKLNAGVVKMWSRLLHAVPGSRLIVATVPAGSAQQRLLASFAAQGIAASRIECAPKLGNEAFWRLHGRIDVALDPFPMNGGTTTCETLWMGVPVVTLAGASFAGRAGCSILVAAGFPEWIAASEEDYLRIACTLVQDRSYLAQLRAGMRERLRASALLDGAAFARGLEKLYREAWREWCAKQG